MCSALASGSEVAYFALTPSDIDSLKERGYRKAVGLLKKPDLNFFPLTPSCMRKSNKHKFPSFGHSRDTPQAHKDLSLTQKGTCVDTYI